jgi:hypothetical protein
MTILSSCGGLSLIGTAKFDWYCEWWNKLACMSKTAARQAVGQPRREAGRCMQAIYSSYHQ